MNKRYVYIFIIIAGITTAIISNLYAYQFADTPHGKLRKECRDGNLSTSLLWPYTDKATCEVSRRGWWNLRGDNKCYDTDAQTGGNLLPYTTQSACETTRTGFWRPSYMKSCDDCHVSSNVPSDSAAGPGRTKDRNENLCIGCHKEGGSASDLTLTSVYQSGTIYVGRASSGTTNTITDTNINNVKTNDWINFTVLIMSGSNAGQSRLISANSGQTITLASALPNAISAGDLFVVSRLHGGNSHSWSGFMPLTNSPNNSYGLRSLSTDSNISVAMNSLILGRLGIFGECRDNDNNLQSTYKTRSSCESNGFKWWAQATCGVCHNVHTQNNLPWHPERGPSGVLAGNNTIRTVNISGNLGNNWVGAYIRLGTGTGTRYNKIISQSYNSSTNITTLTLEGALPGAPPSGVPYLITKDRGFVRIANTSSELCIECHYWYRDDAVINGISRTNVRVWDGNPKSHPVNVSLSSVTNPNQYFPQPLEPNFNPQTGAPRYHINGIDDNNNTNNLVLDASGRIRCMTCHGVHFTDSNSTTIDIP